MESTGVYWIAPHEVLEAQGLQVLLVDTRQLARVPRDKNSAAMPITWLLFDGQPCMSTRPTRITGRYYLR